ncbi:MAG: DUF5018 domain-containing protein [Spirochaetaceae bacterium]|nr:DUF5018 domain-containing protein [Spirochaetaceae bacterium]
MACSNIKDTPDVDSRKEIAAFTLKDGDAHFEGTIAGETITVGVPNAQRRTGLTAEVEYTGIAIYPVPAEPADYDKDVQFTVTAADGSTAVYTVQVVNEDEANRLITEFTLPGVTGAGTEIKHEQGTITVTVPHTTTQTTFTPAVVVPSGATYTPTGPVNFDKPVVFTVTAEDGNSKKNYQVTVKKTASTANTMSEFVLLGQQGTFDGETVTVELPAAYSGSLTGVVPDLIVHTGASILPAATAAQDFSSDVTYVVTAESGSQKTYIVKVTIAGLNSADILVFRLEGVSGTIAGANITVTVPYETDLSLPLIPTITHNGASIAISPQPGPDNSVYFNVPVTITVTAESGDPADTKIYTVNATKALCPYKTITSFIVPLTGGQSEGTINNSDVVNSQGNITGSTITVIVPNGTDCASLAPTITVTEPYTSINPVSGAAHDFSDPVTYVVTALDGTTNTYTVIVMPSDITSKSILNFVLPGQLNVAPMIDHGAGDEDGEITVLMPIGAALTSLVPTTIIHTGKSVLDANVPKNFDNPVSYTVEAGNETTKTYLVRITHPILPPLTAGSHAGYVVETENTLDDGTGSGSDNIYNLFDNNLDTYVCYYREGTVTVTWSGAQAVNRVRVIPSYLMILTVAVEFRNASGGWVPGVSWNQVNGEFIQQIPASMDITGIKIYFNRSPVNPAVKPRIGEFIIE